MKSISITLAVISGMFLCASCKKSTKEEAPSIQIPKVITLPVTNITSTTAVGNGYCYDNGGDTVTKRGVCFSFLLTNPDYENGYHTLDGPYYGVFTSPMNPLLPNTTYYIRAYAENRAGIGYGAVTSFKTAP